MNPKIILKTTETIEIQVDNITANQKIQPELCYKITYKYG